MEKVEKINIHEMHTFLAYRIDRMKLNKLIAKGENVKQL